MTDYEGLLEGADLAGSVNSNDGGKHVLIQNVLEHFDELALDRYFGINFLDIETTGLSGYMEPLFLIGLLKVGEEGIRCTQLLARNPSEEASILLELLSHVKDKSTLMTFNGDSFDIPYIVKRMSYCNLTFPEVVSVDLLKPARKRFKDKLASCSLQSLERNVLKLSDWNREDDIPGSAIPRVYWEYVNSGNHGLLLPIIKHNLMDLLSTARLWALFMRP
ncbi:MAG TPA: ribonuclease H-like domain-containing protein [Bacillota bacterium]|nr:ribonuclease H-like domain-containing protein [Bacillota bacterium]